MRTTSTSDIIVKSQKKSDDKNKSELDQLRHEGLKPTVAEIINKINREKELKAVSKQK